MANEQNLRPGEYKFTLEEAKKGGKASGEAKRRRKTFKELMELFGEIKVPKDTAAGAKLHQAAAAIGLTPEELTHDMAVVVGQYLAAEKGNTNAAVFVRDTKGEKPHDVLETPDINYKPLVDLTKRKKNGEDNGAQ